MAKKSSKKQAAAPWQAPQWLQLLTIGLLMLVLALFFFRKIDLTTADLGRHLKNGEVVLTEGQFITKNVYSFTHPEFPVVTHHWASGVIFYLVYLAADFGGLTVFSALLAVFTFYFLLRTGGERNGWGAALLVAAILLPLLGKRVEIRPESFSYLLFAVFIFFCHRWHKGQLNFRQLALWLLPLQLLWVNLHIQFVLGIGVVGAFMLGAALNQKRAAARQLLTLSVGLVVISLANPSGIYGLLEPFTIFREYGYMVAENQPVWFMQGRALENYQSGYSTNLIDFWRYLVFELATLAALFTWGRQIARGSFRQNLAGFFILLAMLLLAWFTIRSLTLFAIAAVVFLPDGMRDIYRQQNRWRKAGYIVSFVVLLVAFFTPNGLYSPLKFTENQQGERFYFTGLGLLNSPSRNLDVNGTAKFIKRYGIQGPIFNNYDIGSYLIWHLYPQEKVFVDNRPEAYPVEFFKQVYIPMQEDEAIWQAQLEQHDFNAIVFYRNDMTPWGQNFLISRVKDEKAWAPVFVDNFGIIFLRRNQQNKPVIQQFEPRIRPMLQVR